MAEALLSRGSSAVLSPLLQGCKHECRRNRDHQVRFTAAALPSQRGQYVKAGSHSVLAGGQVLGKSSFVTDVRWGSHMFGLTMPHSRREAQNGTRAIFTGIVEEMGTVRELKEVDGGWELTINATTVLEDVKLGDSIAVNGTCLTVTRFDPTYFAVGLAPETLRKTSLELLEAGSKVNLERSLQPSGRMGGHFVQGHVDGTGVISSFEPDGDSLVVTIKAAPELLRYIVKKGYIAVDGTSLTVVDVLDEQSSFTFMLVAYTQQHIVIPLKKVGDKVNLEVDIVGKYVERMTEGYRQVGKGI